MVRKSADERSWPPGKAQIRALIEEAVVDAYGESEQAVGFLTMLDEHLRMRFETEILGVRATIERVDITNDDQIIAICRRGRSRQTVLILDLPLPKTPPVGAEWIEAYRHWARGR
jgi:hypothetical protein